MQIGPLDTESLFTEIRALNIKANTDEFYSNLNSWVQSALKIIQNYTDIAYDLLHFPIENGLFDFYVGEIMGGKPVILRSLIWYLQ